jgi:hypothetical protein
MKILQCRTGCVCLVLVICLAGCCAPGVVSSPSVTPIPPSAVPTKGPSFTPVSPSVPTLEMPTGTPTPSPIPPTRTPRPTPVPTMTADEEYAFVSEMLRDNGGCQLPCWWGFTPGETSWETTQTFFASLGREMHTWNGSDAQHYTVYFDIPDHHFHYQSYHEKGDVLDRIGIHAVPPAGEDGYYAYGDPQFAEDWRAYMLSQILEAYGLPSQVFLETYKSGPDRLPFRLLLFYPSRGFLVMYEGSIGEEGKGEWVEAGKAIRICPWRSDISLWLWSPDHVMTFGDLGISSQVNLERLRSLEEATGMSVEQFYETFVQPDAETCLETPADLW